MNIVNSLKMAGLKITIINEAGAGLWKDSKAVGIVASEDQPCKSLYRLWIWLMHSSTYGIGGITYQNNILGKILGVGKDAISCMQ